MVAVVLVWKDLWAEARSKQGTFAAAGTFFESEQLGDSEDTNVIFDTLTKNIERQRRGTEAATQKSNDRGEVL